MGEDQHKILKRKELVTHIQGERDSDLGTTKLINGERVLY